MLPRSLFYILALHLSLLISALAAGSKIFAFGPLSASATVLPYALTYLITDYVNECYGRRIANLFVLCGFFAVSIAALLFQFALVLPGAIHYTDQQAFEKVFALTPRLVVASLSAYLISQYLDVKIFDKLRMWSNERHLWLRNNLSTLCSQFIDTAIFILFAFTGEKYELLSLIGGQFLIKAMIAMVDTPLLYAAVYLHRKYSK